MHSIEFKRPEFKEYESLSKELKKRIDSALEILSVNPTSELLTFKRLRGVDNTYRICVGDYRIVYSPNNEKLIVWLLKLGTGKMSTNSFNFLLANLRTQAFV